jgi:hypothetical protein
MQPRDILPFPAAAIGHAPQQWWADQLTEEELDRIDGHPERVAGVLLARCRLVAGMPSASAPAVGARLSPEPELPACCVRSSGS